MPRVAVAIFIILVAAMPAHADDQVIYLEESGRFEAGLPAPVAAVNAATFDVVPVENHTRLRFAVGFEPEGVSFDTLAAEGTLRFRMHLELSDPKTGEALPESAFRFDRNGTITYETSEPVRATLWLQHGAGVEWRLRVSALPDPIIVG